MPRRCSSGAADRWRLRGPIDARLRCLQDAICLLLHEFALPLEADAVAAVQHAPGEIHEEAGELGALQRIRSGDAGDIGVQLEQAARVQAEELARAPVDLA